MVDINTIASKFEVVTPGNIKMEDVPGLPPSMLASYALRGLTWATADSVGYPDKLFRADNNNFGPRIGAAFQLNNKTVLRGGYGEYFWPMPLSQILQASRTNPPMNLRYENLPDYKNATQNYTLIGKPVAADFIGGATVDTNGVVVLPTNPQGGMVWDGRNWRDSRVQSWNVTVEREVMKETTLRLSYLGQHGSGLEQRFSLNQQESEYNYVARTGQAPPSNRNLLRVNKDWNPMGLNRTGYSNSNGFQVEVERRFSRGVAFQWFYTYNRVLTTTDSGGFDAGGTSINSAGGGGQVPENLQIIGAPNLTYDQRLALVYFNSTTVPPHHIRYNGNVELPFGRGKRFMSDAHPVAQALLGGWQIAFNGDWRSGFWLSPSTSLFAFGDPRLDADSRPEFTWAGKQNRLWFRGYFDPTAATNVVGGDLLALVPVDRSQRVLRQVGSAYDNKIAQTLANGSIRQTAIGENYNWSPRANIMGPGAWNTDIGVYKNFRIGESVVFRLKGDFFNAFNHPNDINPNATTGMQDLSRQANDGRVIQLSLRVDW